MSDKKAKQQNLDYKQIEEQLKKFGSLTLNKDNLKKDIKKPKVSREELKRRLKNKINMNKMKRQSRKSQQAYIDKKTKETGQKIDLSDFDKLKLSKDTIEKLKKLMPN